jgi:Zn finger protein HypA/HybF involved in hydrogenase expression
MKTLPYDYQLWVMGETCMCAWHGSPDSSKAGKCPQCGEKKEAVKDARELPESGQ